jgi:actin-like ATPase involved in cell morphogenesis
MTAPDRYRLAVDFGTSTTVAMLQWPDGRIRPLLFDGSPLLPSSVVLGLDGRLHTGRDAAHLGRGNPERLEMNPKRRIDDGAVLLGDAEIPVPDLITAVLRRVAVEAGQVAGAVGDVIMTHPAAWGGRRRALLLHAAERAGLARPSLVNEPVAAAAYFARLGAGIWPGAVIVVYDLGAGTCDVTVLRRQPYGFDVVVSGGLGEVGGLDVDAAIVAFLQATHGQLWTDTASRRQLWDEVRTAKEMLSRASSTIVMIPALGTQVPLGRDQFEELARPVLRPTTALVKQLLRDANIQPGSIAGLYLVGGSSKIPLCATLLHEALGVAPIVTEQPELVVAEGSLHATSTAASGLPTLAPVPSLATPGPTAYGRTADPQTPTSGLPAGLPVSGAPISGLPVSSMPTPHRPTSGLPAFGPPASAPPIPGPVTAGQSGGSAWRRPGVLGIVAAAAALLLVGGVPVVAYQWFHRTSATSRSGLKPEQSTAAAVKYRSDQFPQRPCDKADLGPLATTFEAEATTPFETKNVSTVVNTFTCTHTRNHMVDGIPTDTMSATFFASIYADPVMAANAHKTNLENGKLAGSPVAVAGIGKDAFVYRSNQTNQPNYAMYVLDARDDNLVWELRVTITRPAAWSDQELNRVKDQTIAAAKASFGKLTAR